jgi:hypothetical protein
MSRIRLLTRQRVGTSLIAIAVVTAAVTLVAPLPASASIDGLQFVTASTAFDSTVYKAVTVACPSGTQVIGTGFQLVGAPGFIVLDDLIPTATTLRVGAGEIVGPGEPADGTRQNWRIDATALCGFPPLDLQIASLTSSFGSGPARDAFVLCPSGRELIGGGASLSQGFGQISMELMGTGDTFVDAFAEQDDDGYTGSWSVTSYAICAFPIPGLQKVVTTTASNSFTPKTTTATCPAGTRALGGGWSMNGQGQVYITGISTQTDGETVTAYEDGNGYSGDWSLTAYAICANP